MEHYLLIRVKKIRNFFVVSLVLGASSLLVDTVYFNNGAVLKGVISEQNTNTITIIVDGINTTYGMRDVNRIENSHYTRMSNFKKFLSYNPFKRFVRK